MMSKSEQKLLKFSAVFLAAQASSYQLRDSLVTSLINLGVVKDRQQLQKLVLRLLGLIAGKIQTMKRVELEEVESFCAASGEKVRALHRLMHFLKKK